MSSNKPDFPIIGIGTSAGGMTAGSGMAFILIIHLGPAHSSNLIELLKSHTGMKVNKVTLISLHVTKKITEPHGGTIRVEENKPQRSIFTLTLPKAVT